VQGQAQRRRVIPLAYVGRAGSVVEGGLLAAAGARVNGKPGLHGSAPAAPATATVATCEPQVQESMQQLRAVQEKGGTEEGGREMWTAG
jgi:hypothetical protein